MKIPNEFEFPKWYKETEKRGYLDVNTFQDRDDFSSSSYVWFYELEIYCEKRIKSFKPHAGQQKNIIPFAGLSDSSFLAWVFEKNKENIVLFCPKDDCFGEVYAPSFEEALFRNVIEFASQNNFYINDGNDWEMDLVTARKHIERWLGTLLQGLPEKLISEIKKLLSKELVVVQSIPNKPNFDYFALLTPDEANKILSKYLDSEMMGLEIKWISDD